MDNKGLVIVYNNEDNNVKVEVKLVENNVWMTQDQIVALYQSSKSNISEHIKHILEEKELTETSTVRKFRIVQIEGERNVVREIEYFNLDVVLSVGYRVKSSRGIEFRDGHQVFLSNILLKDMLLTLKDVWKMAI